MNLAYRWFIGYPLNEAVPHFATVSYNFNHRFNTASVEYVFRWVLKAAADEGYLDTEAIFVDGTHIKASVNLKKQARKAVPKEAKRYAHELFEEINRDWEAHGKKPFEDNNKDDSGTPEMVEKTVSATDPECGVFHKGEHKKVFAYEAHTACDKHNFVTGVHVTPGNVHDSVAFDPLYDDVCKHYPEHKIVAADSTYKTPWICKRIFESGRPYLGITYVAVTDEATAQQLGVGSYGIYIVEVNVGSGAAQAGLEPGDRIVSIDGAEVAARDDVSAIVDQHAPGDTISITVARDGQMLTVSATLGEQTPNN